MPRFGFTPVEHDPFERPDATGPAIQYARELGGSPANTTSPLSLAIRKDLSEIPNLLLGPMKALETVGNGLMRKGGQYEEDSHGTVRDVGAIDAATTLSGLVMEGGLAMPRPSNSLGVFGGMNAKTADLKALGDAMRMDVAGHSPEEIHASTGWFKGVDGKWKFEISDKNSRYREGVLRPFDENAISDIFTKEYTRGATFDEAMAAAHKASGKSATLEKILDHPDLYAAYPSLRKMPVERTEEPGASGYYDPQNNLMAVAPKGAANEGAGPHSTTLHEVQHAIQTREDFAHGGNTSDPEVRSLGWQVYDDLLNRRDALRAKLADHPIVNEQDAVEYAYVTRMIGKIGPHDKGEVGYQSLAGEVEARNVQHRHGFGIEPKDKAPWETEDTPRFIQKVRKPIGWYRGAQE